jgi:hypothetical protein
MPLEVAKPFSPKTKKKMLLGHSLIDSKFQQRYRKVGEFQS